MTELNPSEAQRKAMLEKLADHSMWDREGMQRAVDEMIAAANSIPEGAPVGTIARRPDGAFVAVWVIGKYWAYTRVNREGDADWPEGPDADSWPQVRPDEWPVSKVYSTEEAAEILGVDLTAQQELTFPVVDPHGTVNMDGTLFTPKPRTPRVVDRLGVDEQGSRWLDVFGWVWSFENGWWKTKNGSLDYGCVDPSIRGPFKEILEPRVLPSLDCKEARDGTVWEARYVLLAGREQTPGWKFQHTQDGWVYEDGSRVLSPEFLTGRGPYTEVLGDPS